MILTNQTRRENGVYGVFVRGSTFAGTVAP